MRHAAKKPGKLSRIVQLEELIEECEAVADDAEYQSREYRAEYRKLTGKDYEY